MSVGSILIALQASRKDGKGVTSEEFLTPLKINAEEAVEVRADRGAWAAGMVCVSIVRQSEFEHLDASTDAGVPTEAFFHGIKKAFVKTANFLNNRSPDTLCQIQAAGVSLRLFIDIRMDQDQMELELPTDFLAACSRHQLGIFIISNDC